MEKAKAVFEKFKKYLKGLEWHYETDTSENNLVIITGAVGDDLPMKIIIRIIPQRSLICVYSPLPFKFDKERKTAAAVAVSMINHALLDGSFDYDFNDGSIIFKMVNSYDGCEIVSNELFEYLVMVTASTVDKYNDKFLMVSKGMMNMEDLSKFIDGEE